MDPNEDQETTYEFQTFVDYYDNWSLKEMTEYKRVITACYFACTTLSTVGFGDYYPVSNEERLVGSFFLLFGVAIFSFFMGELCEMILKVRSLDDEIGEEEELDKFFVLLRLFNHGQNVDHKI